MLTLRDYQRDSIDALYDYWSNGGGNGLIVLPTGAGKALVIAALIKELLENWPDLRIACVTHTKELISQNCKELLGYWPGAPAGIYSAGLGRRDTRTKVLFCGIQSVWNKVNRIGAFDVVIVDECHLISRSADTSYGRFFSDLRALTPDMRVVGATATPFRLDSGRLDQGDDRIFDEIVYEANVRDLIEEKYLSPLINKATRTTFDVSGVGKRGGDYIPGQLQDAVNQDAITSAAVAEIVALGHDRKAWLAFCAGVEHAIAVRDAIRSHGLTCEAVHGATPPAQRDAWIAAFRAGRIRCLTSVGVLSTGFNVPQVDLIALLRPTQSAGLYIQQVGRALRKAPGKENALILDFSRLIRSHGPIDAIVVKQPKKGEGAGQAPVKTCFSCEEQIPTGCTECPYCGAEFERAAPVLDAVPDEGVSILSTTAPEWLTVTGWSASRHRKPGKPDSLKVTYRCGLTFVSVWVCLEHEGYARAKAERWWKDHRPRDIEWLPPDTVDEALSLFPYQTPPLEIRVRQAGKFQEVVGYRHYAEMLPLAAE